MTLSLIFQHAADDHFGDDHGDDGVDEDNDDNGDDDDADDKYFDDAHGDDRDDDGGICIMMMSGWPQWIICGFGGMWHIWYEAIHILEEEQNKLISGSKSDRNFCVKILCRNPTLDLAIFLLNFLFQP